MPIFVINDKIICTATKPELKDKIEFIMIKLIFFDIDDTLSRQGVMATHNIDTLKDLAKTDIKLVIATGRARAMLPDDVMALAKQGVFDAIICMNGQYNFIPHHLIPHNKPAEMISDYPLSLQQAQIMVDICQKNDVTYKFDTSDKIAWGHDNRFAKMTAHNPNFFVAQDIYLNTPVYQCSVFFNDGQKTLNTNFAEWQLKLVHWHSTGGDILPIEASKARAVYDVCQHFAIDVSETMAFGDGLNDLEMFDVVGKSIAMGDAKAELKALASHVTGTIEEQGIQTALAKFGLT